MAAPTGNQNAKNAKIWQQAIKRALARASNETVDAGLDRGADKLVQSFFAGEQWAVKEVGERLDGKAAQSVTVCGDPDNPLQTVSRIELIDLDSSTGKAPT